MTTTQLIVAIAAYQQNPHVHPLTCGVDSNHNLLVPEYLDEINITLRCPDCSYQQFVDVVSNLAAIIEWGATATQPPYIGEQ